LTVSSSESRSLVQQVPSLWRIRAPLMSNGFTKEGEKRGPLYEFFPQRYASSYERLLDDFVSQARLGAPFSVTIHDGLCSLALAEAARRSADNRLPISMSAII
ncbi:MAG: Gfo/Idh/MocA family oxidoreductase, partial [Chthoniobacterales bacterium]